LPFWLLPFLPPFVELNSEESERVSELKSISGSSRLPYGTLALGAEGIKNAIKSFDDACVWILLLPCPSHSLIEMDVFFFPELSPQTKIGYR
jgi:hypothetical protein